MLYLNFVRLRNTLVNTLKMDLGLLLKSPEQYDIFQKKALYFIFKIKWKLNGTIYSNSHVLAIMQQM